MTSVRCAALASLKKKRGGHPRHGAAVQLVRSIHPGAWTAQRPPIRTVLNPARDLGRSTSTRHPRGTTPMAAGSSSARSTPALLADILPSEVALEPVDGRDRLL